MNKKFAVLPCNGIDKGAGCISREIALCLNKEIDAKVLCPVFFRVSDLKYKEILKESELLVIDGCNTKCASKLAIEKNIAFNNKINVSQEAKNSNIEISNDLFLKPKDEIFIGDIVKKIVAQMQEVHKDETDNNQFNAEFEYEAYKKDKFVFRLALSEKLLYIENDVWVYVDNNIATVGVTDYAQQSLGDILFFEASKLGTEIAQFDEVGIIESSKATLEVVSPVSGKIIGINKALEDYPEYINDNPYEKGWLVKIELTDFKEDRELLVKDREYFEILKRKVDNYHV